MPRSVHKIVLYMLVAVMAMAPLQGIRASIEMMPAQAEDHLSSMSQSSMVMHQSGEVKAVDHCLQKCKNCQQHQCSGHHQCHNGQCFSGSAMVLSSYDFHIEFMTQSVPAQFVDNTVVSLPSTLFRPPRA